MATERTITIKGDGIRYEAKAYEALTPGHLILLDSDGYVKKHDAAGQNAPARFAVENDLEGDAITDDYAADERCQYNHFRAGDQVLAILSDGQNAAIESELESSATAGELSVHAADSAGVVEYPDAVVGRAAEAVDASDSATTTVANRRIIVTIV